MRNLTLRGSGSTSLLPAPRFSGRFALQLASRDRIFAAFPIQGSKEARKQRTTLVFKRSDEALPSDYSVRASHDARRPSLNTSGIFNTAIDSLLFGV